MFQSLTTSRCTKIIATVGPASSDEAMLKKLIHAGANVFRLNFSHGSHESHRDMIEKIRRVSAEVNPAVALLADLQGPKLRVGQFPEGGVMLDTGQTFTFTNREGLGSKDHAYISYKHLPVEVTPGERILCDDGLIQMRVVDTDRDANVHCEVTVGGLLRDRKGVNLPETQTKVPALTEKDLADLRFAVEHGVDFVALSFVRAASDVSTLKQKLHELGSSLPIVAKVEKPEALQQLDEILHMADAIMVARGDLGVEIEAEMVPIEQKRIITVCNRVGKPVIVATQMLESMVNSPRPTRAEAADVANAILDGADAIMLSAESAAGKYPEEAVAMMAKIASEVEPHYQRKTVDVNRVDGFPVSEAVTQGVVYAAEEFGAKMIVTFTHSGSTARLVAKRRPRVPVVAFSPSLETIRSLGICWGVRAAQMDYIVGTEQMMLRAGQRLLQEDMIKPGDYVAATWGMGTVGRNSASTDSMRIYSVYPEDTTLRMDW